MKNTTLLSLGISLATGVSSLTTVHAQTYTITATDPGVAPLSVGRGINDRGDTVARSFDPANPPLTADVATKRRKQGQARVLAPLPGYTGAGPTGINNRGDVIGVSTIDPTNATTTLWKNNGQVIDLGTLPGWPASLPHAINDDQMAVGYAGSSLGSSVADRVPVRWNSDGIATQITHPAYQYGVGLSLAPNGTVAGVMWNDLTVDLVGFIADRRDNVTIVPPLPGGSFITLEGISANGTAVGHGDSADGLALGVLEHAIIRQRDGTITPVYPLAGYQISVLRRINASGTAIGLVVDVMSSPPEVVPVVYANGNLHALSLLVNQPPTNFWVISEARDINEKGQISATAVDVMSTSPVPVAVILTPE